MITKFTKHMIYPLSKHVVYLDRTKTLRDSRTASRAEREKQRIRAPIDKDSSRRLLACQQLGVRSTTAAACFRARMIGRPELT